MDCRPGSFVLADSVVARVDVALDASEVAAVAAAVRVGTTRTIDHDPEFAVHQMVEIALRALSPGVNDPYTAINALDWIGDAVHYLAGVSGTPPVLADTDGRARVITRAACFADLIKVAFDQIRQAAADAPAVTAALVRVLGQLRAVSNPDQRAVLVEHLDAVAEAVATRSFVRADETTLEASLNAARLALG
jgi:uncharacterized membrane protein